VHLPAAETTEERNLLHCPMPGLIVDLCVALGDLVYKGQRLLVLESMKMESGVASPCDGVVVDLLVAKGQPVEAGELLIRFRA